MPPYCGFPRLSHQFPAVEAVVIEVDVGEVVLIVVMLVVIVVFVVELLAMAVVDDEVAVFVQEVKTSRVIIRKVVTTQKDPLFIVFSFHLFVKVSCFNYIT